jgi:hypothetical protein
MGIFMQLNKLKVLRVGFLILIFLLGFVVRLYRFNGPVADWHSWRQADTSSVSRNFVNKGFDVLHPTYQDLSNVPSGLDNPNGYRFVEFPIYNVLQAGGYVIFPKLTLEEWGRLITILASLLASLFLYLIVKKRFGALAGFLSLVFFIFTPFNIYYGRTILPDPSMVTASLGGIYFFYLWIDKEKNSILSLQFLLSLLFTVLAFLLKPYALFFTLPMVYLVLERFGLSFWKKYQLWFFAIVSLIPLVLWRLWMTKYPAGIPVSNWLFNAGNIRFKPAYFYWIFADRIARLISGYWGVVFVVLGFLKKYKLKDFLFVLSFVVSSLFYLVVIARGNVQHDYYQILIIPSLAMLMGLGALALLKPLENYNRIVAFLVLVVCFGFTIFFGWYYVRDYFNINNPSIVVAGVAVDKLTPKNAKVIANYGGDTSFLYQTKRSGWASYEKPLPQMVQMGADYLVIANPIASDLNFGKTYKIVAETSQYVIFNLRQKP